MTKTILITGANGNLGTDVVTVLGKAGFHILATTGNGGVPEEFSGLNVEARQVNLLDETATAQYIEEATQRYPHLEAAILLVGGFAMGGIKETDGAALDKMFALNFKTAFFTAKPLFEHFEKTGGGQIILIGARPSLQPEAGKDLLAYSITKSLIFRLAEIINEAGKGKRISATVIVPSTIDTPVNRAAMPQSDFSKWITGTDIAETIAFVLSGPGKQLREAVLKTYNET